MNNNYTNGNYHNNSIFSKRVITPNQNNIRNNDYAEYIPNENSYIENILRLNKGKKVSIYQSFFDNNEVKEKIFTGIIEQCGKDHIILSDPTSGNWYLLLMSYVNYIKCDEEINTSMQFYSSIA